MKGRQLHCSDLCPSGLATDPCSQATMLVKKSWKFSGASLVTGWGNLQRAFSFIFSKFDVPYISILVLQILSFAFYESLSFYNNIFVYLLYVYKHTYIIIMLKLKNTLQHFLPVFFLFLMSQKVKKAIGWNISHVCYNLLLFFSWTYNLTLCKSRVAIERIHLQWKR